MASTGLEEVFAGMPGLARLRDRWKGFLQVLLPAFTLTRQEKGLLLDVTVSDDLYSIVDGDGKREFFAAIEGQGREARDRVARELSDFHSRPQIVSYRFECRDGPFRYANGGVLPVVRLDDEADYFCLFYRDIFPVGWNIANGASDGPDELLHPDRVLLREFGEELFLFDPTDRLIYTFDPGDENRPLGYQKEALDAWARILPDFDPVRYKLLPMPLKWVEGPDRVRAAVLHRQHTTGGLFLNVTPEDNAIEVDRVALINVRGDARFIDGEVLRGTLLNRIVGLFDVARFGETLGGRDFRPDRLYVNGEPRDPAGLDEAMRSYPEVLAGFRTPEQVEAFRRCAAKFDLCPLTRALIRRYYGWLGEEGSAPADDPQALPAVPEAGRCDLFISYKSADAHVARRLYEYLSQRGVQVFCSDECLARMGSSDYITTINKALDEARCLVVLGTRAEHFRTGWVEYEWKSFLNEILSGRKRGELFTFASDMTAADLPFALRGRQLIPYSPSAPQSSFEVLHRFVGTVLRT